MLPFTLALSYEEVKLYGCPNCGYRSGHNLISVGRTQLISCGDCQTHYIVLHEGAVVSELAVEGRVPPNPVVTTHPRVGIPARGADDIKPYTGGEFFHSRGIGLDYCTCFACAVENPSSAIPPRLMNNIAAFAQGKAAAERIQTLFGGGARVDYRDYEPDRVQVKIGACDTHLPVLERLDYFCSDGTITKERINYALALESEFTCDGYSVKSRIFHMPYMADLLEVWLASLQEVRSKDKKPHLRFKFRILQADHGYRRQLINQLDTPKARLICELRSPRGKTEEVHLHFPSGSIEPWNREEIQKFFSEVEP